jgi:hypothetical protein
VAALFAVHPLHVESVAWVAERKDVLSALFFLLTLGAYARYVERPSSQRYGLVALCLAVGLMAKAMLVTVPMVLLLLDFWPLGRIAGWSVAPAPGARSGARSSDRGHRPPTALFVEKLPLLAIVAASSVVTFLVQRAGGAVKSLESFPLSLRAQNAVVSYVDYLRTTVWPVDLGVFYPFPPSLPAGASRDEWRRCCCLRRRHRARATSACGGGGLVLVPGHARAGDWTRADRRPGTRRRYMYLPLIGIAIAVAWGALAIAKSATARWTVAAAGFVAIAGYAHVGHAQVQYWRDTVTLWSHTAEATDDVNNFGVYFGLAEYLRANGRAADSIPVYEKSIAKNGAYVDARLGLVRSLVETGQTARAISALQETIALQPDAVETRMSLALLLTEAGRAPEAIAQFGEAVRHEAG